MRGEYCKIVLAKHYRLLTNTLASLYSITNEQFGIKSVVFCEQFGIKSVVYYVANTE